MIYSRLAFPEYVVGGRLTAETWWVGPALRINPVSGGHSDWTLDMTGHSAADHISLDPGTDRVPPPPSTSSSLRFAINRAAPFIWRRELRCFEAHLRWWSRVPDLDCRRLSREYLLSSFCPIAIDHVTLCGSDMRRVRPIHPSARTCVWSAAARLTTAESTTPVSVCPLPLIIRTWRSCVSDSAAFLKCCTHTHTHSACHRVWSSDFLRRGSDGMELASTLTPGPCSEYR